MPGLSSFVQEEFDHAWNAHGADRVLDLFAPDAVVKVDPPPPGTQPVYRGRDEIKEFVESLIEGFHVESRSHREEEGTVTWSATVRSEAFRQNGIDSADADCEAEIADNKVRRFQVRFTPDTASRFFQEPAQLEDLEE